jgi:hypothetical protein
MLASSMPRLTSHTDKPISMFSRPERQTEAYTISCKVKVMLTGPGLHRFRTRLTSNYIYRCMLLQHRNC